MARKRAKDFSIILPWERRGGLLRRPGISRARPILLTLGVVLFLVVVAYRDRTRSGVRATRASLLSLRQAVDAYRAEHGRQCPSDLLELERAGYVRKVPADAWGSTFILQCPGRFDADGYELSSSGPDRIPGGLDRVE
ncbi:MAG: type II secretion system protein GspG [Polyangiaceae bacterium]|jgi:general secretion pathway protein G|nr:type II secretion system protein GspG [Polyangiaceae bacterium]